MIRIPRGNSQIISRLYPEIPQQIPFPPQWNQRHRPKMQILGKGIAQSGSRWRHPVDIRDYFTFPDFGEITVKQGKRISLFKTHPEAPNPPKNGKSWSSTSSREVSGVMLYPGSAQKEIFWH